MRNAQSLFHVHGIESKAGNVPPFRLARHVLQISFKDRMEEGKIYCPQKATMAHKSKKTKFAFEAHGMDVNI